MTYSNTELLVLSLGALGLGMYLLFKGGDWTIESSVYIARRLGISPLVIGFTIVAFGTSLPELLVSVNANLTGSPGIAIGNVIGSNIANILFVLGVTAFFGTLIAVPRKLASDMTMMLFATVVMLGLMLHGDISRLGGGLMLAILLSYVVWQYIQAARGNIHIEEVETAEYRHFAQGLLFLVLGLVGIAVGAEFLVRGAKVSASIIGVPEDVIGLSVIALGTSLPELSTCIIAVAKKQSDIVLGNILGSNVFNILMIVGLTALIKDIPSSAIAPQVVTLDIWVMAGVAALFAAIIFFYRKINKVVGSFFVAGYVLYIAVIYMLYLNTEALPMVTGPTIAQ